MSKSKSTLKIDQALTLLFAEPNWTFKVGIGCLINGTAFALLLLNPVLLPISFCLWSLAWGYILATINAKVKDPASKLPEWNNLLELLMAGGTWIPAWLGHCFIFFLFAFGLVAIGESTGMDNVLSRSFVPWASATWSVIMILAPLLSFFSLYLMVNFAVKQQITSAFAVKEVLGKFRRERRQFLEAWLIHTGLIYLATLVPILTLIGVFMIPSTLFLAQLIGCLIVSQAWHATNLEGQSG
jgi:hypothetical protein